VRWSHPLLDGRCENEILDENDNVTDTVDVDPEEAINEKREHTLTVKVDVHKKVPCHKIYWINALVVGKMLMPLKYRC
jgi:hypothetical protein